MGVIRLILALTIVLGHIYAIFGWGDDGTRFELVTSAIAFQSFFIVSGFYTTMILNEKYVGDNWSWKRFLGMRFLRIYPMYWLILALTLLVCFGSWLASSDALVVQPWLDYWGEVNFGAYVYAFIANLSIFGQESIFFLTFNEGALEWTAHPDFLAGGPQVHLMLWASQVWAVSFIMLFYFVAPLFVRKHWAITIGLLVLSLVARYGWYALDPGVNDLEPWRYRFFPFEFGMFLMGVLSYKWYGVIRKLKISKWFFGGVSIAFIIFSIAFKYLAVNPKLLWDWEYATYQWFYYILLALLMPILFEFTKKSKVDRFIGEISLPIFLAHFVIIHALGKFLDLGQGALTAIILLVLLAFGAVFVVGIQQPFERFRASKFSPKSTPATAPQFTQKEKS